MPTSDAKKPPRVEWLVLDWHGDVVAGRRLRDMAQLVADSYGVGYTVHRYRLDEPKPKKKGARK